MVLVRISLFCSFLCVFFQNAYSLGENGNITELLELIETYIEVSSNYVIPKDNSELLEVTSPKTEDFGTYDFIVVGSGAAGSVIANRLSEISDWDVLLLEAGGIDNNFTKILGLSGVATMSNFSWGYNTTSQQYGCLGMRNQACAIPHGKVIGGSTTINDAIYARGHRQDFDRWVSVYGNIGWSYDEVLPYFKKSENAIFEPRDEYYHGEGGYLTTSIAVDTPELTQTLVDSLEEIGFTYGDYNGELNTGVSRSQLTFKGNERVSTSTAFLRPFVDRKNLKISLNSFVTKVVIDEDAKNATGVEFVKNGTKYVANVRKEVIISAGGYNSPQILMLSGVGPKEHLEELKIPLIANLPVGQFLQDQVFCLGMIMKTNQTLYNYTLEESVERYVEHLRPLVSGSQVIAQTNFGQGTTKRPEVEFSFSGPAGTGDSLQRFLRLNSDYGASYTSNPISDLSAVPFILHPKSRGAVTLKSNSPNDKPLINPNILADIEDVEKLYQAAQMLLELNESETFKSFGAVIETLDSPYCQDEKFSDEWWICWVRHWSAPTYHPTSSNSMGTNPESSVVNPRLQVHGIKKLRVADESVMPESISGHNMAPVIMIGERAADIIKEDYISGYNMAPVIIIDESGADIIKENHISGQNMVPVIMMGESAVDIIKEGHISGHNMASVVIDDRDADIIKEYHISGHKMAPVNMIGEHAVDIIKADYGRLNKNKGNIIYFKN